MELVARVEKKCENG